MALGNVLKWLFRSGKETKAEPQRVDVGPATQVSRQIAPAASDAPASGPAQTRPDGNYFAFNVFIEMEIAGVVYVGLPKVPIRDMASGLVRWGAKPEDCWPDPSRPRARWMDDPKRGIHQRKLRAPEDVLGAEGAVGDMRLRFERILDAGANVIVYALFAPDKNIRVAYGWSRDIFERENLQ